MEDIKILIYRNINMLQPVGGPNGYLYNLKKGIEELEINNIEFLSKKIENIENNKDNKNKIKELIKKIYNIQPKLIKKIYRNNKILKFYKELISDEKKYNEVQFNDYDYIHFNSTLELYKERKRLSEYKGKIILSTHSPKPAHLEKLDDINCQDISKKIRREYEKLEEVDIYAFNRADYIFFPCEEAEEPYYNQWDKYKEIKEKNKEKYRYILTGIPKCVSKISKEEIRKQYDIPQDAFLISYVGRHNEVKGYDILKDIGKEVLKDNRNIYIIVAGKEGPLYKLNNKKWIEVGWTNDPHSIINASDLFILPNRETYFDLILLEVLSLGVPMLVSYTGGNKYFSKNYSDIGIEYFSSIEDAINKVLELSKLDENMLKLLGKKNTKIYEKDFNEKIFAENYIKLINSL